MIGAVSDDLLAADQEDESLNTYKATLLGRLLYPTTSRLPVLLKILFIAPPFPFLHNFSPQIPYRYLPYIL
jgi:hypothetical protein